MEQAITGKAQLPINRSLLILILGLLATIDPFSIDFYLPAFADIAKVMGSTTAKVSLSMSSYFIGLAIGQISYGPVIDRFGRKKPLYFGLTGYMITCIGCMTAHSVNALIVFRFIQALSGGVAGIAAYAMVRDFFPLKDTAKIFSLLVLIIGISPLVAPTFGGFIADLVGWQWIFAVLIAIVLIMIALIYFYLPEGHQPDPSISLSPKPILKTFYGILTNPQFITYTLAGTFSFTTLFIYVAGSPVIFMDIFKVSPKNFGLIFTLLSVGFISSSQINVLLLKRYSSENIFRTALSIQIILSVVFLTGAYLHLLGLVSTIVFFMFILSCLGSINPNAGALALAPFNSNIGSASALMGFLQLGISSVISSFIGLINAKSMLPVTALMACTALISLGILLLGRRKIKTVLVTEGELAPHII